MTPLVSIVVVSYNHSKYIKENLDSIQSQTYPNIELIVADDASSDNSVEVFEEWLGANNFPALKNYHKKNTGLATTLNECIELAKGKYIKIIAADDYLEPTYIEKCVDQLLNSNAEIVFTNAFEIDSYGKILSDYYFKVQLYETNDELIRHLMVRNFISGATMMTTKELYSKVGEYKSNILLEDYNLVLRSLKRKIFIVYISENLIRYRRHENNITAQRFDKLQIETIKEKINFDDEGKFKVIIQNNIITESKINNNFLPQIKKIYYGYAGFNLKFYIIHFYPKLYSFIKKCFQ